jgi:hypothetical protein
MMTNECTSIAARFEGLADAPEQYRWHRLMWHVHGYSGSHWILALSNYSLRIAPAAGQQANKQQSTNAPKKVAILMAMATRRYVTVHIQWRRFRALLDATKCHHWTSVAADRCNWSRMCRVFLSFFIVNLYKKVTGQR